MNVGDVVISIDPHYPLHCGSGIYSHAICISIEPLVLASDSGDMRWQSTLVPERFIALCAAHPDVVQKALRRINS